MSGSSRVSGQNSPVAKLAKSFGIWPKVSATSATVRMISSTARPIISFGLLAVSPPGTIESSTRSRMETLTINRRADLS